MIKTKSLVICALAIAVLGLSGCIAGKVSQDDLSKQWHKFSGEELQKMFCNKTMSGFGEAEWKVFWSSDCRNGKLEVGPNGAYKTQFRTVKVLNDAYCTTPNGTEESNCYSLYEKDGKYLDIKKTTGEQSTVNIIDGIPTKIQKEIEAFSTK